jgi:hypothetical protein
MSSEENKNKNKNIASSKKNIGAPASSHPVLTHANGTNHKHDDIDDGLDEIDVDLDDSDHNDDSDYFDSGTVSAAAGNDHQDGEEESKVGNAGGSKQSNKNNWDQQLCTKVVEDKMIKRLFEIERDRILASLPKDAKERFGEIWFAKYSTYMGPVLIMNPYHVPPGPARDCWVEMYQKVGDIVWHAGDVDNSCYSFPT